MRVLFTIVAIIGLFLVGLAFFEVRTAWDCRFKVAEFQPKLDALEQKYVALVSKQTDVKYTGKSLAQQFAESAKVLDSLERDCSFVGWAGGALFILGTVGIIIGRRAGSQKSPPNKSLQATAAAPASCD
jgi:hypothetical protein